MGALVFTPLSWPFLPPSKRQLSLVSWLINSWSPAVRVFKTPHFHPQHFLKRLIAIVQVRRWNPGLGVCEASLPYSATLQPPGPALNSCPCFMMPAPTCPMGTLNETKCSLHCFCGCRCVGPALSGQFELPGAQSHWSALTYRRDHARPQSS